MTALARSSVAVAAVACIAACRVRSPDVGALTLVASDGTRAAVAQIAAEARFTVFVFEGGPCACAAAHAERLRSLAMRYGPRGVRFVLVDERSSDALDEATTRLGWPRLVDPEGRVARWAEADYSTYSVIVDERGWIHYRGAIDSDAVRLHDEARPWLADALSDLFTGREPRVARTEALGCALPTW